MGRRKMRRRGMGRRHGEEAWGGGMGRRHGEEAWGGGMGRDGKDGEEGKWEVKGRSTDIAAQACQLCYLTTY